MPLSPKNSCLFWQACYMCTGSPTQPTMYWYSCSSWCSTWKARLEARKDTCASQIISEATPIRLLPFNIFLTIHELTIRWWNDNAAEIDTAPSQACYEFLRRQFSTLFCSGHTRCIDAAAVTEVLLLSFWRSIYVPFKSRGFTSGNQSNSSCSKDV